MLVVTFLELLYFLPHGVELREIVVIRVQVGYLTYTL